MNIAERLALVVMVAASAVANVRGCVLGGLYLKDKGLCTSPWLLTALGFAPVLYLVFVTYLVLGMRLPRRPDEAKAAPPTRH